MKTVTIQCHRCGSEFERRKAEYTRSLKVGRPSYCSQTCATVVRNSKFEQGSLKGLFVDIMKNTRKRAAKMGWDIDITESDLAELFERQEGKCAMSGVDMDIHQSKGNPLFYVSLDRINNDLGYTVGNLQLTCRGVNYMKNRWSDEHAMELLLAIAA